MCTVFDFISSNIDEILSINLSTNVLVFGDFNVRHKDWLTYSGRTDKPGKLCYNFPISNDLTQMVNFPIRIPDCNCHSPALLGLFLSSDFNIFSTMAFPPSGNSDHVVVSVPIVFPINSKQDAPFHHSSSAAASNFVIGFRLELMFVSISVSCLYQQNKSSESSDTLAIVAKWL